MPHLPLQYFANFDGDVVAKYYVRYFKKFRVNPQLFGGFWGLMDF